MIIKRLFASFLIALFAMPAVAEEFSTVQERSDFVQLVAGKRLTRLGIHLKLTDDGIIDGKAFGKQVSGDWKWNGGFFCRSLFFGETDLGPNCQMVKVNGSTLRFISDRGTGIHADLVLKN